jgi:RNA polymerase sigma factor (sigma-70 family)
MSMSDRSDEELLTRCAVDPPAFEELYRRHAGRVVGFAVRRCARPSEVHDLVAAVWLEVIAGAERFDPKRGRAVPWILGIASNLSASEVRRRSREREALLRLGGRRVLDDDDLSRLEREIDAAAVSPQLREALSLLPGGERAVIELVALDGLTPGEAARALGIVPAAARMRLARARRKLRRVMGLKDGRAGSSTYPVEEVAP